VCVCVCERRGFRQQQQQQQQQHKFTLVVAHSRFLFIYLAADFVSSLKMLDNMASICCYLLHTHTLRRQTHVRTYELYSHYFVHNLFMISHFLARLTIRAGGGGGRQGSILALCEEMHRAHTCSSVFHFIFIEFSHLFCALKQQKH